jgi:bifunctional DNA-binding transcriptional regulator/antitoxin component of YhaV-PrlF toxin-antitoxin module
MDSVVTSKGHVRIQKVSRKHSGLKPGDRIKFFLHPDGSVVLLPKLPAASLRGIVKSRRRPVTIKAMNEAAAAGAAEGAPRRERR